MRTRYIIADERQCSYKGINVLFEVPQQESQSQKQQVFAVTVILYNFSKSTRSNHPFHFPPHEFYLPIHSRQTIS